MVVVKIVQEYVDREAILDIILKSKTYCIIGLRNITYETHVVLLFKPQYIGFMVSNLCKYVSVLHRLLDINTSSSTSTGMWLVYDLPFQTKDEEEDTKSNDSPSLCYFTTLFKKRTGLRMQLRRLIITI